MYVFFEKCRKLIISVSCLPFSFVVIHGPFVIQNANTINLNESFEMQLFHAVNSSHVRVVRNQDAGMM